MGEHEISQVSSRGESQDVMMYNESMNEFTFALHRFLSLYLHFQSS